MPSLGGPRRLDRGIRLDARGEVSEAQPPGRAQPIRCASEASRIFRVGTSRMRDTAAAASLRWLPGRNRRRLAFVLLATLAIAVLPVAVGRGRLPRRSWPAVASSTGARGLTDARALDPRSPRVLLRRVVGARRGRTRGRRRLPADPARDGPARHPRPLPRSPPRGRGEPHRHHHPDVRSPHVQVATAAQRSAPACTTP